MVMSWRLSTLLDAMLICTINPTPVAPILRQPSHVNGVRNNLPKLLCAVIRCFGFGLGSAMQRQARAPAPCNPLEQDGSRD